MDAEQAKYWKSQENVLYSCDIQHGGNYVPLQFIENFWRCPMCNKRAFEANLQPEEIKN